MSISISDLLTCMIILFAIAVASGCSSMPDQRIEAVKASLPDNVLIAEYDSPSDYPHGLSIYNAYTHLNAFPGVHVIYTVKGNVCLLEHEARHVTHGPGHDGFPERLIGCAV